MRKPDESVEEPDNSGTQSSRNMSPVRTWSVVFILLIFVTLSLIDRNLIALIVDPIRSSFGINDFQMGLLQGPAFAAFFLLGSLPMGWLVD